MYRLDSGYNSRGSGNSVTTLPIAIIVIDFVVLLNTSKIIEASKKLIVKSLENARSGWTYEGIGLSWITSGALIIGSWLLFFILLVWLLTLLSNVDKHGTAILACPTSPNRMFVALIRPWTTPISCKWARPLAICKATARASLTCTESSTHLPIKCVHRICMFVRQIWITGKWWIFVEAQNCLERQNSLPGNFFDYENHLQANLFSSKRRDAISVSL